MTEQEFNEDLDNDITLTKRDLNNIVTTLFAGKLGLFNNDGTINEEALEELRDEVYHDLDYILGLLEDTKITTSTKYTC